MYGQANMLARKFYMCTDDVKIALFRVHCTSLYPAHLWCEYTKAKMKKLQVAYPKVDKCCNSTMYPLRMLYYGSICTTSRVG